MIIDFEEVKKIYNEVIRLKNENNQLKILYNSEKNKQNQMELFMKIRINEREINKKINEIEG